MIMSSINLRHVLLEMRYIRNGSWKRKKEKILKNKKSIRYGKTTRNVSGNPSKFKILIQCISRLASEYNHMNDSI